MNITNSTSIECLAPDLGGVHIQKVKDKAHMLTISQLLKKPILKYTDVEKNCCRYFIIDGITAYLYEETVP